MVYAWPGNVRELENVVEHAAIMATQDMITADLLPLSSHSSKGRLPPLTEAKESFERDYLRDLLQITEGNISRAAQIAGRYRSDFYKLLKKYRLYPLDKQVFPYSLNNFLSVMLNVLTSPFVDSFQMPSKN